MHASPRLPCPARGSSPAAPAAASWPSTPPSDRRGGTEGLPGRESHNAVNERSSRPLGLPAVPPGHWPRRPAPAIARLSRHLPSSPLDSAGAFSPDRINLPQGADTHITIEEYKALLDAVTGEGQSSPARRLFDDNRMRHRWLGQQELAARLEAQSMGAELGGGRFAGPSWKDGPPVVGTGENELHPDDVHITGRIFGEEYFKLGGRGGDDDEGLFDFDGEDEDLAFGA